MVEVFKTDIHKKKVARTLVRSMANQFPDYKINIDLTDRDKVLRVESAGPFDTHRIVEFIKSQRINIEPLTW